MKDFNLFLDYLIDNDIQEKIDNEVIELAIEKREQDRVDENLTLADLSNESNAHLSPVLRSSSMLFSLKLLQEYHKWLNLPEEETLEP